MFSKFSAILLKRKRRTEFALVALIVLVMALFRMQRVFDPMELLLLDLGFHLRGQREMPREIVVIGIDEKSLDHPKAGAWPWPRGLHAQLLDQLNQPKWRPQAIGYDLFFEDSKRDESGDLSLTYKTQEMLPRPVFGYLFERGYRSRFEKEGENNDLLEQYALPASGKLPPRLESFDKVSLPFSGIVKNSGLGFLNSERGRQGKTYKVRLLALYKGRVYPSLDLLTVMNYLGAKPANVTVYENRIEMSAAQKNRKIPITPEGDMRVDFYANPKDSGRFFSFIDVMLGDSLLSPTQAASIQKALKNNLVFVGRTALALKDGHTTPFDSNMASVFLRAEAAGNILENRFLVRFSTGFAVGMILLLGLSVLFMTYRLSMSRAVVPVLGLCLLVFAGGILTLRSGLWIDTVAFQLTLLLSFGVILLFRYVAAMEELRKTQAQLLHSTKMAMVGQVSSGMAHEFRNIIHAVRLHVEGCARPGMSHERVQRYMGVVFKIINNAEQILNGILSFSRKNESNRKLTDLRTTVEDTLLLLKKELQYQNIRVIRHLDEVSEILIDNGQMAQVIMNLINNARDALKETEDKVIIISVKQDEHKTYLDIADNGPGIPPHILKKLFEPFVTSKKEGQGTGLGLSVCRGIVENHNGEIKVTSQLGQGTAWHIVLPRA